MSRAFDELIERVGKARKLLTLTHVHPDGDGLGAMIALGRAAWQAGRVAELFMPEPVPWRYRFLFDDGFPARDAHDEFAAQADRADLIVVADTCSFSQLEALGEPLRARREKIVVIDHHATRDALGSVQWVDTSAAATGLMMMELLEAMGWAIDPPAATALAAAILSDTGWLRFSNTDGRALRAIARLVEMGVCPDDLYEKIYQVDRPERLKLLAAVLEGMDLQLDDRLAVMTITREDFERTGARPDETENLINESLRIGRVEVAVLLVEQDAQTRVSLRSRHTVDVSAIAATFGGGGHARAAGFRSSDPVATVREQLTAAVANAMK